MIVRETRTDRIINYINYALLTLTMLIVLYPLIYILSSSISDPTLVNTGQVWLWPRGITFDGYKRIFQDSEVLVGYRNTFYYTIVGTCVNLVITLTAAYALSKKTLRGRKFFMFLFTFTMYFGGGMIPTYLLIKDLQLINTWFVLIISGALSVYNLIIARTFFMTGVPVELEEAAVIDGCSRTRAFIHIVLPLSKALIGVLALYYGIGHWNNYFSAMIYLTDRNKIPLQLVLREILIEEQSNAEMMNTGNPLADEGSMLRVQIVSLIKYGLIVVASVPVLIVYPFLQKYFDKGVMLGSLKG